MVTRERHCYFGRHWGGVSPEQDFCEPEYTEGIWLEGCLAEFQAIHLNKYILGPLATLYQSTGEERYALRALELLDAWAGYWQDYVYRIANSNIIMSQEDCDSWNVIAGTKTCGLASPWNGAAHELDRVPLAEFQAVKAGLLRCPVQRSLCGHLGWIRL